MNKLNLISKDMNNGGKETIVWTRVGNRGPEWLHGQVQFSPKNGGNFAFIFEGM